MEKEFKHFFIIYLSINYSGIKMLITHETLDRFKTSNKLFDGINVSLEAKEVLKEQKYKVEKEYDIFLSHSFQDAETVYALYKYLKSFGWSVYVDWIEDSHLDRQNVTKSTSNLLKLQMARSRTLIYASSKASKDSKWMPWELGFFDGHKPDRVAILPIVADQDKHQNYSGVEYLSIYPYIEMGTQALWLRDPEKHNFIEQLDRFIRK
ncbi:MAG: toll/interleukin-1 receptor domain-containing protein [Paludibacteraceae bacterium]|nr:toll/interleukin-1 receptor domain-containing protein [Paludibacteraceae bacterium]